MQLLLHGVGRVVGVAGRAGSELGLVPASPLPLTAPPAQRLLLIGAVEHLEGSLGLFTFLPT